MGLFKRKKPIEITPEILNQHLDECRERVQVLRIDSLSKEITVLRSSLEQVKDASQMDAVTGSFNRMTLAGYPL